MSLCSVIRKLTPNHSHEQLHHNGINVAVDVPFLDFVLQFKFTAIRGTVAILTIHQRNTEYQISKD